MTSWNLNSHLEEDFPYVGDESYTLFSNISAYSDPQYLSLENTCVGDMMEHVADTQASSLGLHNKLEEFRSRRIEDWTGEDSFDWALATCRAGHLHHSSCRVEVFKFVQGAELVTYTEKDFEELVDSINGPFFYDRFRKLSEEQGYQRPVGASNTAFHSMDISNASSSYSPFSDAFRGDDCSNFGTSSPRTYTDLSGPNYTSIEYHRTSDDLLNGSFESSIDEAVFDCYHDSSNAYRPMSSVEVEAVCSSYSNGSITSDTLLAPDMQGLGLDESAESITTLLDASGSPDHGASALKEDKDELHDDVLQSAEWFSKIPTGGPRKNRIRSPKSWEFVLRLLQDTRTNPRLVKWEDEEQGIFRLMRKEEISRMWGSRSAQAGEEPLAYESFARLLRHHYKTETLRQVREKQMVYMFGPKVLQQIKEGKRW